MVRQASTHARSFARPLLLVLGYAATFSASACTAILVPDPSGKDDGVARCNNVDDCPDDLEDNRFRYQCVYGEGQSDASSKVCVADFEEVNCHPDAYASDSTHPFPLAYADATDNLSKTQYVACTMENLGKQGCGFSLDAPCQAGLVDNGDGICDDSDPATPKAVAPNKLDEDVEPAGQDVVDQFCGWYFDDDNWVCDTSGAKWVCRDCSDSEAFGKGGCGKLYIQGAPSPVYTNLADANDGTKDDAEVTFGPVPEPAP